MNENLEELRRAIRETPEEELIAILEQVQEEYKDTISPTVDEFLSQNQLPPF